MKKGVFIYGLTDVKSISKPTGVDKKVLAQIHAINAAGLNCKHFYTKRESWVSPTLNKKAPWCNFPSFRCFSRVQKIFFKNIKRVFFRLPFGYSLDDPLSRYHKMFDGNDFFYIRRMGMSLNQLLVIRKIRKRNPKAKILYEIPTYPYKKELKKRWIDYPLWWKERTYMPILHRYVDRIVTISKDERLFGMPTIPIINGINLDTIHPIKPVPEDGAIHIVAVAMFCWWHGYDRLIRGLGEYYASGGERPIVLHLIGGGPFTTEFTILAKRYGVSDKVIIHGYKTGAKLDEIYDLCHLGVISLATEDKDIYIHSTLKSREYLAKGLPTIATGTTDVFIGTDYPYNLELPTDTNSVNIQSVISFYDSIYCTKTRQQVIAEIRAFAERHIDMNITMEPVIRYLSS